jgi:hypothetical protein
MFDLTSPLFIAINIRNIKLVNALLDYGAKVEHHRTEYFGQQYWNSLDAAIYGGNNTGIEKIILSRCNRDDLEFVLVDSTSLINAIESNIPEKIELILAFFIELCTSPTPADCSRIAFLLLGYEHRNFRFLYEFLVLFPNMKDKLDSRALEKYGESKSADIIRNFDC